MDLQDGCGMIKAANMAGSRMAVDARAATLAIEERRCRQAATKDISQ